MRAPIPDPGGRGLFAGYRGKMADLIKREDVIKAIDTRLARFQAGLDLIDSTGDDPLGKKDSNRIHIDELLATRTAISRIPSVKEET